MNSAVSLLKEVVARRGLRIAGAGLAEPARRRFELAAIQGRLTELSAAASSAALTAALALVGEAQKKGETAAWLTARGTSFFPPDAAALGIDLAALVVVRVPEAQDVARAADRLARSGGFGLVVLDLGTPPAENAEQQSGNRTFLPQRTQRAQRKFPLSEIQNSHGSLSVNSVCSVAETATLHRAATRYCVPAPLLSRLGALASRHNMAVVFLTEGDAAGSLGSLVSIRASVSRRRTKGGRFAVSVEVVKDKRAGPGWRHVEVFHGPAGLR
jgi:hypothetical protein